MQYTYFFYTRWAYMVEASAAFGFLALSVVFSLQAAIRNRKYGRLPMDELLRRQDDDAGDGKEAKEISLFMKDNDSPVLNLLIMLFFSALLFTSIKGFVGRSRIKDGYIVELNSVIFPSESGRSGGSRCLVHDVTIYPNGMVGFEYTIPPAPAGTKYVYVLPAEFPAESRRYEGFYERIFDVGKGRFLTRDDLSKLVDK